MSPWARSRRSCRVTFAGSRWASSGDVGGRGECRRGGGWGGQLGRGADGGGCRRQRRRGRPSSVRWSAGKPGRAGGDRRRPCGGGARRGTRGAGGGGGGRP